MGKLKRGELIYLLLLGAFVFSLLSVLSFLIFFIVTIVSYKALPFGFTSSPFFLRFFPSVSRFTIPQVSG